MEIAMNYDDLFKNRLVVITGVARSGTTIIGKIIGSLENVYYIFEPNIFYLFPTLIKNKYISETKGADIFKSVLFEDFFLQNIQGRYVNFNKQDDSYIGNYMNIKNFNNHNKKLKRKIDVLNYLENNDCKFIIKIPNIQPCLSTLKRLFLGIKFIDVIRNGIDVVGSSIRRDFYSEKYLNERNVDWIKNYKNLKIPHFIKEEDISDFLNWNHYTRAAYIWRILTEEGLNFGKKNKSSILQFNYENFLKFPKKYLNKIENFIGKKRTNITEKHIESIKFYNYRKYDDVYTNISSPEKERFIKMQKKLGY